MDADVLNGRPFWQRLGGAEKAVALAACAGALAGTALIADGLYIKAKASLSQVLLQRSFAAELSGYAGARPWPWADFVTEARIAAPRLGAEAIVLRGASGETLAFGPAHLEGTPLPGEAGTAVIAAHRDTHFRWLKDLHPGDEVEITRRDGRMLVFEVSEARIAPWNESGINASALGVHLALATCWPFDATTPGPLRYIVDLELVRDATLSEEAIPTAARYTSALSAPFPS
ncbi:class GN sortase [Rhizobium sp. RU36D]|uniref:class GN sortase n=1 Tax=Rhizobium sp. RU36D TaxID=1907415 RepID=UPI0009D883B5|nr:class GN sortase [Rhizobium sp. RU36D]SMC61248.1 sortase A [Rhizobium sp. RU36D]